ncbi:hypothetical protein [Kitasatospora sp. NPDC089509]|uniref:hypothetical protein n=1 Tax=Kitasatospora sp. NPDC089509 TaxID=3364079 RepID=UPI00381E2EE7
MTTAHRPRLLAQFGTGRQLTRITETAPDTVRWQRTPGPQHPDPYRPVPADVTAALHAADGPPVAFATPDTAEPDRYAWDVNGRRSLGELVESGRAGQHTDLLRDTAGHLGRHLRRLHDHAHGRDWSHHPRPGGPLRLAAWLRTGRGPRAATGFRHLLHSRLGPAAFARLTEHTDRLLTPDPGRDTLLHGWFSLGSVVLADTPDARPAASVLSGPEAAVGRPETDAACLLGELTEYRMAAHRAGLDWSWLDPVGAAFLAGYGEGLDPGLLAAAVTVRVATHACDFACYVGWDAQLHGYVPMLAELLDLPEAGAAAR